MLDDVPRATVVVTNPTHYAVAVRYDRPTMKTPKVVAKGAGDLAKRLAARARLHGVPVIERPPVARALYRGVALGHDIPQEMFVAVAEIIAFVYRLRGR
jgi:flagellar biosynthetic protein FlhB